MYASWLVVYIVEPQNWDALQDLHKLVLIIRWSCFWSSYRLVLLWVVFILRWSQLESHCIYLDFLPVTYGVYIRIFWVWFEQFIQVANGRYEVLLAPQIGESTASARRRGGQVWKITWAEFITVLEIQSSNLDTEHLQPLYRTTTLKTPTWS